MTLSVETKQTIIKDYQKSGADTGSAAVQVALITNRINDLQGHFNKHNKDHHSRLGLLKLVGKRRRLLDYIKRINIAEYRELIGRLELRK